MGQFAAAGIRFLFQHYEHAVYPQLHGDFASHLSALDLALNCGPGSLEILRSGRRSDP
ncbi:MAG: WbqC family protein [Candidatus Handelsmanbacteria bacterium]|nr:WbqC family protein [Candidatus Handelsmanbacteria bacterium]